MLIGVLTSCDESDIIDTNGTEGTEAVESQGESSDSQSQDGEKPVELDKEKWNAALQDNVFDNLTFKMYVKTADGEMTGIYKLDGNRCSEIGEDGDVTELPADSIDGLKNIFINTSLAILDNYDDFEYDEGNNCYKAKKDVVYSAAVLEYTAELTVKNAVVTFDSDLRVATIAGNMTQVISNGQTMVFDFEFTFSDYGTTVVA